MLDWEALGVTLLKLRSLPLEQLSLGILEVKFFFSSSADTEGLGCSTSDLIGLALASVALSGLLFWQLIC